MVILAAVDGEEVPDQVVQVGHDLASDHKEALLVLHVMPQEQFDQRQEASSESSVNLGPMLAPEITYDDGGDRSGRSGSSGSGTNRYDLETAQRDAEGVARDVVDATIDDRSRVEVTALGRVGEPVEEILSTADREDARYLVIGGRKRTPVGKAVFGSVTQSILLSADRPVMTVMESEE